MTPQEMYEKYAKRTKAAVSEMEAGIKAVTEAPGKAAALQSERWIQALQKAQSTGKWAKRVASVTLDQWKEAMINKGLSRVAAGVDNCQDKYVNFAEQLIPFQTTLKEKIRKMPNTTLEDSISRASAWIRGMADFKVS